MLLSTVQDARVLRILNNLIIMLMNRFRFLQFALCLLAYAVCDAQNSSAGDDLYNSRVTSDFSGEISVAYPEDLVAGNMSAEEIADIMAYGRELLAATRSSRPLLAPEEERILDITTTEYGQLSLILDEQHGETATKIIVSGPIDWSDFAAIWDCAIEAPEQFAFHMLSDFEDGRELFDLALGLEIESVTKAGFTRQQSPFVIIGETGKGKTNTLKILLNQIVGNGTAYLFDSSAMSLYPYQDKEGISYIQDEDEWEDFIDHTEQLCNERKQRYRQELDNGNTISSQQYYQTEDPVYIIIDDIDKFLTDGSAFEDRLYNVITDAAECGIGIIITVHSAKLKSYDSLSKWVKTASHGLVLSPQGTLNIFPVRSQREYPQMGYGLLFHNGEYAALRLPECK